MEGIPPLLKHTFPDSTLIPAAEPAVAGSKFPEESREGHGVGGSPNEPYPNFIQFILFYHINIYIYIVVKYISIYIISLLYIIFIYNIYILYPLSLL